MSRLTDLFKQFNLSTIKHPYSGRDRNNPQPPIKQNELMKVYGEMVRCEGQYAYITCNPQCTHYLYSHDESFAYNWAGQSYLVAKAPLPVDVLHELIALKSKELKDARKKRFEKIKTPRDALRVTFRDLNIEVQMVSGVPRVACGPFEIEFHAGEESPQVEVSIIYQSHYINKMVLTTLSLADPGFNNKVQAIVFNGKNLKNLMLGEIQPKPLEEPSK